ncbi:uncharacterized protein LOC6499664 isoform X2 [Drosophila ananassae]|uniref:uncharacterized protein LOC6499664 isoform X2 n=1 Tax=Drosophila ananassae TaxID=7217 RepID=UPI0013A5EDC8|nr:uncharacterized protein LOC6499664 isoform X2 [Drosophila ananassae]
MDSKGTQTEKKSGKIRKSNQKGRITLPDEVPLHHQNEPVVTESQAESEHRPSNNEPVYSCGFEVFGIVQGVSFRMHFLRYYSIVYLAKSPEVGGPGLVHEYLSKHCKR